MQHSSSEHGLQFCHVSTCMTLSKFPCASIFCKMEAIIASIVMFGIYKKCLETNLAQGKHSIRLLAAAAAAIIITSGGNKVQKIGYSSSVPVSSPILHFHRIQEQSYISVLSRNILGSDEICCEDSR